ncbi:DUF3175 domain-containing protein [Phyllobacterium leguminum]|uniref:Uncharacterized protein DUF3175 n=1 Tax=Phyllobacterium leguminum TaxID=314237 RepID=A0A318T1N0_9HYPH|nr:DUF3175 domain-containing protein [Phyllobacterium leguminum]PYE88226.1 uncharacterized protein DUF3175 [Phyllobacterium leguminum]
MTRNVNKWSGQITEHDSALGLEPGVFAEGNAKEIAASLKHSAEAKQDADPYRSAMSMLDFYINRAGKNLSSSRRQVLEEAKDELRRTYGRPVEG